MSPFLSPGEETGTHQYIAIPMVWVLSSFVRNWIWILTIIIFNRVWFSLESWEGIQVFLILFPPSHPTLLSPFNNRDKEITKFTQAYCLEEFYQFLTLALLSDLTDVDHSFCHSQLMRHLKYHWQPHAIRMEDLSLNSSHEPCVHRDRGALNNWRTKVLETLPWKTLHP